MDKRAVMVKPEGDIAVTHYCCRASLFHLMAYGGKRAEAVGLNLLELFPSGLGTPAPPASVEGRERFGYGRIQSCLLYTSSTYEFAESISLVWNIQTICTHTGIRHRHSGKLLAG